MMVRSVLVGLILAVTLLSPTLHAQTSVLSELGTRSGALGGAAAISFSDAFGCALNPASPVNAKTITVSVFYSSPQKNMDILAFGATIPTAHHGSFGLSYYQTKMDAIALLYTDSQFPGIYESINSRHFMINHARPLFKNMSLGINAEYILRNTGALQDDSDFMGIDVGLQYQPEISNRFFRDIAVGISFDNLIQPLGAGSDHPGIWGNTRQESLRSYRFIAEKQVSYGNNRLNLVANLALREEYVHTYEPNVAEKKELGRVKLLLGIEYGFKSLVLRMGRREGYFTGGLGMNWGPMQLGYTYWADDSLDSINSFSLSFEL